MMQLNTTRFGLKWFASLLSLCVIFIVVCQPAQARFFSLDGARNLKQTANFNNKPIFHPIQNYQLPGRPLSVTKLKPDTTAQQLASLTPVDAKTSLTDELKEKILESTSSSKEDTILKKDKAETSEIKSQRKTAKIANSEVMQWPLPEDATEHLSSDYGNRIHPISGRRSFHDGIDIAAAPGTDVLSSAAGKVVEAGKHPKLGNYVKIAHKKGMESIYGHLSRVKVTKNQKIAQGQVIGTLGSTGYSTGPHLHYALKIMEKSVNPMTYLADSIPDKTLTTKSVELAEKDG